LPGCSVSSASFPQRSHNFTILITMNVNKTAFLKLINGAEAQTYAVNTAQAVVIGRELDCQVVLDSAQYGGVSRRHAVIRYQPENLSFEISDLGSSNGTFVNGQRLLNSQLLKSGDRIQLGRTGVTFQFDDPSLPTTAIHGASQSPVSVEAGKHHEATANRVAFNNADLTAESHPVQSPDLLSSVPSSDAMSSSARKLPVGKIVAIGTGVCLVLFFAVLQGGRNLFSDRSSTDSPSNPAPSASDSSGSSSSPAVSTKTITDANGLFQVELPTTYQTESRADGINLASADGSFQGAITAVRTPQEFTADELIQGFTDQQNNNSNLQDFTIQNNETIERGVRIDWVARLISVDSDLDAVTHFVQQDNVVVEIDLFSVDRPFSQQDADEANVILRSLRINP